MHTRAVAAVVLLAIVVVTTLAILFDPAEHRYTAGARTADPTRTLLVQVRDPGLLARGSC